MTISRVAFIQRRLFSGAHFKMPIGNQRRVQCILNRDYKAPAKEAVPVTPLLLGYVPSLTESYELKSECAALRAKLALLENQLAKAYTTDPALQETAHITRTELRSEIVATLEQAASEAVINPTTRALATDGSSGSIEASEIPADAVTGNVEIKASADACDDSTAVTTALSEAVEKYAPALKDSVEISDTNAPKNAGTKAPVYDTSLVGCDLPHDLTPADQDLLKRFSERLTELCSGYQDKLDKLGFFLPESSGDPIVAFAIAVIEHMLGIDDCEARHAYMKDLTEALTALEGNTSAETARIKFVQIALIYAEQFSSYIRRGVTSYKNAYGMLYEALTQLFDHVQDDRAKAVKYIKALARREHQLKKAILDKYSNKSADYIKQVHDLLDPYTDLIEKYKLMLVPAKELKPFHWSKDIEQKMPAAEYLALMFTVIELKDAGYVCDFNKMDALLADLSADKFVPAYGCNLDLAKQLLELVNHLTSNYFSNDVDFCSHVLKRVTLIKELHSIYFKEPRIKFAEGGAGFICMLNLCKHFNEASWYIADAGIKLPEHFISNLSLMASQYLESKGGDVEPLPAYLIERANETADEEIVKEPARAMAKQASAPKAVPVTNEASKTADPFMSAFFAEAARRGLSGPASHVVISVPKQANALAPIEQASAPVQADCASTGTSVQTKPYGKQRSINLPFCCKKAGEKMKEVATTFRVNSEQYINGKHDGFAHIACAFKDGVQRIEGVSIYNAVCNGADLINHLIFNYDFKLFDDKSTIFNLIHSVDLLARTLYPVDTDVTLEQESLEVNHIAADVADCAEKLQHCNDIRMVNLAYSYKQAIGAIVKLIQQNLEAGETEHTAKADLRKYYERKGYKIYEEYSTRKEPHYTMAQAEAHDRLIESGATDCASKKDVLKDCFDSIDQQCAPKAAVPVSSEQAVSTPVPTEQHAAPVKTEVAKLIEGFYSVRVLTPRSISINEEAGKAYNLSQLRKAEQAPLIEQAKSDMSAHKLGDALPYFYYDGKLFKRGRIRKSGKSADATAVSEAVASESTPVASSGDQVQADLKAAPAGAAPVDMTKLGGAKQADKVQADLTLEQKYGFLINTALIEDQNGKQRTGLTGDYEKVLMINGIPTSESVLTAYAKYHELIERGEKEIAEGNTSPCCFVQVNVLDVWINLLKPASKPSDSVAIVQESFHELYKDPTSGEIKSREIFEQQYMQDTKVEYAAYDKEHAPKQADCASTGTSVQTKPYGKQRSINLPFRCKKAGEKVLNAAVLFRTKATECVLNNGGQHELDVIARQFVEDVDKVVSIKQVINTNVNLISSCLSHTKYFAGNDLIKLIECATDLAKALYPADADATLEQEYNQIVRIADCVKELAEKLPNGTGARNIFGYFQNMLIKLGIQVKGSLATGETEHTVKAELRKYYERKGYKIYEEYSTRKETHYTMADAEHMDRLEESGATIIKTYDDDPWSLVSGC